MAKRHSVGRDFLSQIRRCQELLLARSGIDEFYETIRLLYVKARFEHSKSNGVPKYSEAQSILQNDSTTVQAFVDGPSMLSAPEEVVEECFGVLASTSLTAIAYESLDAAFEAMTSRHDKSDKGQYFTPRHVVDFCIDVLRPKSSDLVCDPASGSAAFLKAAFDQVSPHAKPSHLYGFDISRRAIKASRFLSYIACGDLLQIHQVDSLALPGSSLLDTGSIETLESSVRSKIPSFDGFDIIATNPPFAGDVGKTAYSDSYDLGVQSKRRVERDTLFIERCAKLLRKGGRCAIVLPDNKVSSDRFSYVREWLLKKVTVVAVVSLHEYTFRPHTSQKASILFFSNEPHREKEILFYRSDLPGKSSNGELIRNENGVVHDLGPIAAHLKSIWKV